MSATSLFVASGLMDLASVHLFNRLKHTQAKNYPQSHCDCMYVDLTFRVGRARLPKSSCDLCN